MNLEKNAKRPKVYEVIKKEDKSREIHSLVCKLLGWFELEQEIEKKNERQEKISSFKIVSMHGVNRWNFFFSAWL